MFIVPGFHQGMSTEEATELYRLHMAQAMHVQSTLDEQLVAAGAASITRERDQTCSNCSDRDVSVRWYGADTVPCWCCGMAPASLSRE